MVGTGGYSDVDARCINAIGEEIEAEWRDCDMPRVVRDVQYLR